MKTIDELLNEVVEDKKDNLSTTSFKFKTDLWNYFEGDDDESPFKKLNAIEFGTHKGQTTRVLSFLFKKVYTINLPNHFGEAKELNADRKNIEYIAMDLYQDPIDMPFKHEPISIFFIDAVHTFDAIMSDFSRALNFDLTDDDVYFVFDDYGCVKDVFYAVEQLIRIKQLQRISFIGHESGHNFGGFPNRVLTNYEGIICKIVR